MSESSHSALFCRICLAIVLFWGASEGRAQTLHLVADEWCPYNCEPNSKKPGFMVEIMTRAFAEQGVEIHYSTLPWLRALRETRNGKYHATIGASKAEAPDFIFPRLEQGEMRNGFWVNTDSPWQFQGLHSLSLVQLGILAGYGYGPALTQYIDSDSSKEMISVIRGDKPLDTGLAMLLRQRIDALVEDETVMRQKIAQADIEGKVKLAGYVPTTDRFSKVYIAFSPADKNSKKYANILSQAMLEMRANGELEKILARYHLSDWR
ncbi:transporter substrate-binding domain-containing protein [Gilvimarinus agarilyticus]|uniref:substrate-binding periplasmic protein n=1 Tax=Gilvimarinus sp. 2_MG-2023 TaxID=3062666 RepID=UPI001C084010|nr:transporter substrate-binding domain-containing protein [Gilvimarinus sp. 2_MG-2023]MBU2887843.1 transporter substrate-binding domain-containing protein [Gilvimarinus agarilyticus]MDO6572481.1 transporter substrate-binding domain-containing protein [Gilvimarinus sp. 2_MG-2023]